MVSLATYPKLKSQSHYGGCGGDTIGFHNAGSYDVVAMLNHNPTAVATHKINFPHTVHFCADVRKIDENDLPQVDIIWASPSCTHHSIARGGESCDEQERALPEELPRFLLTSNANCLMVENVKEFRQWGPVEEKRDKQGHIVYKRGKDGELQKVFVPVKNRKGEYYQRWVATLKAMGFVNYEYRLINAADYGVPQSRVRYFGIFTRVGIPIVWPKPTHDVNGRYGLPKWVGVRSCLDLEDRGHSIFTREERGKKALKDKSLRRILAGLRKHVIGAEAPAPFFNKYLSNSPSGKPNPGPGIDEPSHTITCQQRLALVQPQFLAHYYSGGGQSSSVCTPCATVTSNPHARLISAEFLSHYYQGGGQSSGASVPCPTVMTKPKAAMVTAQLLFQNNGTRPNDTAARLLRPLCQPSPTVTTNGGNLSVATLLFSNYGTRAGSQASRTFPTCEPARTLTGTAGNQYLMTYYRHGGTRDLSQPCATITTKDRVAKVEAEGFLFAQQFSNQPRGYQEPSRTVVASRRHQYVVQVQRGCPHLQPKAGDSVTMRLLKAVCRRFGIADILMRMLKVPELKAIMGFPADYVLLGNTTEQKAMLGNAVCPPVAEALGRAMQASLFAARRKKRAALRMGPVLRWEQTELFGKEVASC